MTVLSALVFFILLYGGILFSTRNDKRPNRRTELTETETASVEVVLSSFNSGPPPKSRRMSKGPPRCTSNHRMEISSYEGDGYYNGYVCDLCRGESSQGHLNGNRERWFCKQCSSDFCFQCHSKTPM